MTTEERNVIWIDNFEFLSYQKKAKILKLFDVEANILSCLEKKKKDIISLIGEEDYNKLASERDEEKLDGLIEGYIQDNIELITLFSDNYPEQLREIHDMPPLVLYCKGNTQLLKNTQTCAVVGTRKPTEYGKVITQQFVKELANAGVTIVSGLASGIDGIAHQIALRNEGATIAVIAGGFKHIYPASNHNLYKEMIKDNLVITESKPSTVPASYLFPIRNRIIAGLSKAVLIPEAPLKSGTMHTKNYAVDFGKEIFAIPGRINSFESEGTNAIIKQCQASICTDVSQIIEFLGAGKQKNEEKPAFQLDIDEQLILNYILSEKKTYQELIDFTNFSPRELNTILLNMQMKGYIEKLAGNSFIALIKL